MPISRSQRPNRLHLALHPPAGGVREGSYAMPEMVCSIRRDRLVERWGRLDTATVEEIARRVRLLLRAP